MRFVAQLPLTLAFCLALSNTAMAADPFLGTWTFNKARSEVGSVNLEARVFVITGTENAQHLIQRDRLPNGTTRVVERDEILDGQEHPGDEGTVVIARRVDAHTKTFDWTKDGRAVRAAVDTVSADGSTLTHRVTDPLPSSPSTLRYDGSAVPHGHALITG